MRLFALLALADALHKNARNDEIKAVLARLTAIVDDVIKKPRQKVKPLIPTQQMAGFLLSCTPRRSRRPAWPTPARRWRLLVSDATTAEKLAPHKLLHPALAACGKGDEAGKAALTVEKLEKELDESYLKEASPFKPEKFIGRKGKSDRAVLVEASPAPHARRPSRPPRPSTPWPGRIHRGKWSCCSITCICPPSPTTCSLRPAGRTPTPRSGAKFYEDDVLGAPTVFIDGTATAEMGGARLHAKDRYGSLRKLIDAAVETAAGAKVKLVVTRKGDQIDLSAHVSDLDGAGAKVKLRFALVEQTVRYVGQNGVRLHHHVVRALPGGADGFKLEKKSSTHTASVHLGELRKKLAAYLAAQALKAQSPNPERPLALDRLKVVALIQDDESKKVLQAVQADVPEAKE